MLPDDYLTLSQTSPGFYMTTVLVFTSLLKTLEKGEIAHNEQFLFFPQCFLNLLDNFQSCLSNLKLLSANSLCLEESKICCLGYAIDIVADIWNLSLKG